MARTRRSPAPRRAIRQARARKGAAGSIQQAWRNHRRRKQSLNTRTTLANRRAIKTINKNSETKMCQSVVANIASNYGGQVLQNTAIDYLGNGPANVPVVMRLIHGIGTGALSSQRNGSWIRLKNITLKVQVSQNLVSPDYFNTVRFMLVLDRNPMLTDNTTVNPSTLDDLLQGAAVSGNWVNKFQNLDNTGLEGRYKVLKQWKQSVAPMAPNAGRYYAPISNKTVTLKAGYKFKFEQGGVNLEPLNQNLLLFMYSLSRVVPHPIVSIYSRVRFKDDA